MNLVCFLRNKLDLFHLRHHARFLTDAQERHILTDTPVKNELAQRQRQKARKGSSENESGGQVPSCSTASLEVLGSTRWLVARRKQLRNPALLMLRKMTHQGPPCLYCGELYSESRKEFMPMKLRTSHCAFALPYCHYNLYKHSFVLRCIFDGAY